MGLQTTAPTAIPLNPDGTVAQPTWAEGGPAPSVPASQGPGWAGGDTLVANDLNYNEQHSTRHLRGMLDRLPLSDDALFTTCILDQGVWNTGGGTLSVTLATTKLVVDVAKDGGLKFELYASPASPEILGALVDAYVDITDAGAVTVVSVANGAPEPALTPGSVRVYKLVTDATELTDADPIPGIAPFPCLGPTIGAATLVANDVQTVTLSASGAADLQADVDVGGTLTTAAAFHAEGSATFDLDIDGDAAKKLTIGRVDLVSAPTATGEVGRSGDDLVYNDGTLKRAWLSAAGFAAAEGRQEATTGMTPGGTLVPKTVARVAPKVGDLIVRANGQLQGSAAGNMTIQLEQGDGAGVFSSLGAAQVIDSVDDSDADIWTPFTIERLASAPGTTARDYRVKVTNGFSVALREGVIYVWSRPI